MHSRDLEDLILKTFCRSPIYRFTMNDANANNANANANNPFLGTNKTNNNLKGIIARPKILAPATFALTYFMWVCLSYFSTHLYAYFCADWSLFGFIMHPLMVVSPQCGALRWFVVNGPDVISQSFALISSVVVTMLVSMHNQQQSQQQSQQPQPLSP